MRAHVRDKAALTSVPPRNVFAYLLSKGWNEYGEPNGRFSVWHHARHPDAEILLPLSSENRDYPTQLATALSEIESVEDRSQLEILRDLRYSGFDVIRLAAKSPGAEDGSLEVHDGVRLFESAREMLYAAACAAVRPQAVFYSRRPVQAINYMRTARLGQTEHGSYVLTLLSPVAPEFGPPNYSILHDEQPFERTVVETLTRSVGTALVAARNAMSFTDAIPQGVSANLCESIAGLLYASGLTHEVELSVSWALNRPPPTEVQSRISIAGELAPVFLQAAHEYRASDRLDDYLVEGPVIKLERSIHDLGRVTIFADVEGFARKVSVELEDENYSLAVQAHAQHMPVRIRGSLRRVGRSFRLDAVGPLSLAPIDDEPPNLFADDLD